jgi:hypothetical protein
MCFIASRYLEAQALRTKLLDDLGKIPVYEPKPKRSRKLTVEECKVLDSQSLAKKVLSAGFPVENLHANPAIEIGIRFDVSGAQMADMRIVLTATRTSFNALRWWFLCPFLKEGHSCNRRVGKLYLPPRGTYFGCRHCHDLTYRSIREHDKRVDYFRKHPQELLAVLERPHVKLSTLVLALRVTD